MSPIWLIAFVVFLVMEGVITSLTNIWFTGESLAALVVQVGGGDLYPQLAVFVTVSFMLPLMVRPFVYKYLCNRRTDTNVDSLASHKAVVKGRINNVASIRSAILAGETWLARAAQEGDTLEAGDVVIISAISGAKLLVAAAKQEHGVEKVQRNIRRIHMFGVIGGLITFIIIAIIILFIPSACIRIVPQAQTLVMEWLGAYLGTYSVGIHFLVPFVDRVAEEVNLKEQVEDFPPQPAITRGDVTIQIDAAVSFYIMNPELYAYGAERPLLAIENLTATTLRNIISDLELDKTLASRETINARVQGSLNITTDPWGIKVTRVESKNIIPPAVIQEAVEKQVKAEHERRESILRVEGGKKSVILVAEGNKEFTVLGTGVEKEAAILRAKAEKEKKIKEAQGQAEAIRSVQKATADGIRLIREAGADNTVLQLKGLEALQTTVNGKVNKIIIPSGIQGITGLVKSIVEVAAKDEATE